MAKASDSFSYMQEGKIAFTEVISDRRSYTFGESVRAGLILILALIMCVVFIGAINRQSVGGNWYFSTKAWIERISNAFSNFPIPETGFDYLVFSAKVIIWFVGLWNALFDGGWVQGEFDGSVGATPVIRPEFQPPAAEVIA